MASMTPATQGSRAERRPRRVLVIEDDAVSRRILVKTLERFGYDVCDESSGDAGLARFDADEGRRPEIVITDWVMSDPDGLEVCRQIRKRLGRGYVYLMVLTGRNDRRDLIEALEAGADDFATKPVEAQELRARLATAERILDLESALAERVRRLEETLRRLEDREARLVEAERLAAIGAVGITVKHEINNPLTGIMGFANLCLRERAQLPASVIEGLEAIEELARRITGIVAKIQTVQSSRTEDYLPGYDAGGRMLRLDDRLRKGRGAKS